MSPITRLLAQCGGVRPDVIRRVPLALQGPVTIGAGLIAVGLFAGLTWGYASYRLFLGDTYAPVAAAVVGCLGAWFVFTVDRSLALSVDKRGPRWNIAVQVVSRLVLAYALAWTMSTPAVLRFSRSVIETHLFRLQNQMTDTQFKVNAERVGVEDEKKSVVQLNTELDTQNARLTREPDTVEYKRAKDAVTSAERNYVTVASTNNVRIANARRRIEQLSAALSNSGVDPEVVVLERRITTWRRDIGIAQAIRDNARSDENRVWKQWTSDVTAERDRIAASLTKAKDRADRAVANVAARNESSEKEIQALLVPNLAREYTAFRQITGDRTNPDAATLTTWAFAFHGLFFFLECVPLVLKLTWRRGPVDDAMDGANAEDSNRVNLRSDTQMLLEQAREDALRELLTKAIEDWKNKNLNRVPIDLLKARQELDEIAA